MSLNHQVLKIASEYQDTTVKTAEITLSENIRPSFDSTLKDIPTNFRTCPQKMPMAKEARRICWLHTSTQVAM